MAGVAHGETITATGTGQAQVLVSRPLDNAKIVRAVAIARKLAVPDAFDAARNQATRFAIVTGFNLGAIQSIEEGNGGFGFFYGPTVGRFGRTGIAARPSRSGGPPAPSMAAPGA